MNETYFNDQLDLNVKENAVSLLTEGLENLKRLRTSMSEAQRENIDKDIRIMEEMLAELGGSE